MLQAEKHVFFIPLTIKGCVSNIYLKIGEVSKSGQDSDLSAFGCNVYDWQMIALRVENKKAKVFLNGKVVFQTTFKEDFGRIVGLDFRYEGLGTVDYVMLKDLKGNIIYRDDFE